LPAHWSALIWAGLVATTFAAVTFWVFRSFGWTRFTPATTLGGLVFREPGAPLAETLGQVIFFVLGSTLIAALYSALLARLGGASMLAGGAVGAVHGGISLLALPLIGTISASVRSGDEVHPRRFGLAWGRATPVSVVLGHVVYGALLGATLAAFAR
jgi:hypothetical protein